MRNEKTTEWYLSAQRDIHRLEMLLVTVKRFLDSLAYELNYMSLPEPYLGIGPSDTVSLGWVMGESRIDFEFYASGHYQAMSLIGGIQERFASDDAMNELPLLAWAVKRVCCTSTGEKNEILSETHRENNG